jgi:lipid II:glycine glycyltransferase (peptidoglycan interpeptide bridge formation enzyme)
MVKSFLQTEAWIRFKERFGWKARRFDGLAGLERTLAFDKTMLYFPEIPLGEALSALVAQLNDDSPRRRIFTRFEFLELWTAEKAKRLLDSGLIKSFEDVQPEYRQWVTLDRTEEELLRAMKPKGRYNLNLAKRHRLQVEWGTTGELLEAFVAMYRASARRAGFAGRSREYFEALLPVLKGGGHGQIVVLTYQGEVVAAAIVSFYDGVASYLYGGSSPTHRSLMAPYLMHWEIMKKAKKEGCLIYDLLAVAPPDKPQHPHVGLSRFKAQFGGEEVRLLGSWDLVHNRLWYTIYTFVEKRRRRAV